MQQNHIVNPKIAHERNVNDRRLKNLRNVVVAAYCSSFFQIYLKIILGVNLNHTTHTAHSTGNLDLSTLYCMYYFQPCQPLKCHLVYIIT